MTKFIPVQFLPHARGFFPHALVVALFLGVFVLLTSCGKKSGVDSSQQQSSKPWVEGDPFPHLRSAAGFAALSGSKISNAGSSIIYGNIGVSPGTEMVGTTSIKMTGGKIYSGDSFANRAQIDALGAFKNLEALPCDHDLTDRDLSGLTLLPGSYCFTTHAKLNGTLTLDSRGNRDAIFVFQANMGFSSESGSGVRMVNGGSICNVFWNVKGVAQVGSSSDFIGSILATQNIAFGYKARINGKGISQLGAVTMDNNELYNNTCPHHE